MSWEEGTFIEPLACTVRGFRIAGFKPKKTVLVLGSGIAGILNIKLAKTMGASKIFATDIDDYRLKMAKKFGWTKNVLIHQIENQSFEKYMLNQTNFDKALSEKYRNQAKLAVKDEYTFDFLELGEAHSERELERAIIARIEQFLREMGGMFAFMGSQYRLEIDGDEYFIDLLLYHRILKCLVAVELKISEFKPEFVVKMQFYLAALDDLIRMPLL